MEQLDDFPINLFDASVIVLLLGSAIFAYVRGFVYEIFSIAGWIGAITATFYGFPLAQPFARQFIKTEILADLAAGTLIFLFAPVVLSILTRSISSKIKDSLLNSLDRALGFLFGLLRGALVVIIAYIGLEMFVPQRDNPDWVRSARTVQLVAQAADLLIANLPQDYAIQRWKDPSKKMNLGPPKDSESVLQDLIAPEPKASDKKVNDGYGVRERQDMERLIGNTQQQ